MMDEDLILALKRVVLAYYEGRDEMARIAMDALEEVKSAHDGRDAPPPEAELPP